jgi:hypothetical protein
MPFSNLRGGASGLVPKPLSVFAIIWLPDPAAFREIFVDPLGKSWL